MGTLLIFIGGFVGASSAAKKTFLQSWIFLVNLCLAAYLGVFLAPLIIPMLEIPGIDQGYKNIAAVFGLMFVLLIVFYKAVESVFPNREIQLALPVLAAKIGTLATGFFSGMVIVTLAIYCYCQCPLSAMVASPSRESLKETAGDSMLRMIRTVNVFSLQFISQDGERTLQNLGVIPVPKQVPAPSKKNRPENKKKPVPNTGAQSNAQDGKEISGVKESLPPPVPEKRPLKNKITRLED